MWPLCFPHRLWSLHLRDPFREMKHRPVLHEANLDPTSPPQPLTAFLPCLSAAVPLLRLPQGCYPKAVRGELRILSVCATKPNTPRKTKPGPSWRYWGHEYKSNWVRKKETNDVMKGNCSGGSWARWITALFFNLCDAHRAPQVGRTSNHHPVPHFVEQKAKVGFSSTCPAVSGNLQWWGLSQLLQLKKNFLSFTKMKHFPCVSAGYDLQNNPELLYLHYNVFTHLRLCQKSVLNAFNFHDNIADHKSFLSLPWDS